MVRFQGLSQGVSSPGPTDVIRVRGPGPSDTLTLSPGGLPETPGTPTGVGGRVSLAETVVVPIPDDRVPLLTVSRALQGPPETPGPETPGGFEHPPPVTTARPVGRRETLTPFPPVTTTLLLGPTDPMSPQGSVRLRLPCQGSPVTLTAPSVVTVTTRGPGVTIGPETRGVYVGLSLLQSGRRTPSQGPSTQTGPRVSPPGEESSSRRPR